MGAGQHLIQGVGSAALAAHGVPEGLQHFKGDVQQVLVEEVHHVLAQAVAPLQALTAPPAHMQCASAATLIGTVCDFVHSNICTFIDLHACTPQVLGCKGGVHTVLNSPCRRSCFGF